MKLIATIALIMASATAFAPLANNNNQSAEGCSMFTLHASRRGLLGSAAAAALVFWPHISSAEPRPIYLTEPTAEFKANEERAMEFKRAQLVLKKEFIAAIDRVSFEENNAAKLVKDLNDLQELVKKAGGLPLGIKKEDMFKQIRAKKAKGFWPTPVEIAYQSLISEVAYQQSPNLEKDLGNPFQ